MLLGFKGQSSDILWQMLRQLLTLIYTYAINTGC